MCAQLALTQVKQRSLGVAKSAANILNIVLVAHVY